MSLITEEGGKKLSVIVGLGWAVGCRVGVDSVVRVDGKVRDGVGIAIDGVVEAGGAVTCAGWQPARKNKATMMRNRADNLKVGEDCLEIMRSVLG